jgi:RND family efflux transporter MFP subunit
MSHSQPQLLCPAVNKSSLTYLRIGLLTLATLSFLLIYLLTFSSLARAAEITATGVIRAEKEVVVRAESAGVVSRIWVHEGERVPQGRLLVELKNTRQKIILDLAKARNDKAKAALAESQVLLKNAIKELDRARIAGDALPRKDLEDREDQVNRLHASVEAQEAELKQAQEELRLRENELKETFLFAPFRGTVTRLYVHEGDALRPLDTQVLELVALDRLYAEVVLPVEAILKVGVGHPVSVRVESEVLGRAGVLQGAVSYANPKVDAASRTFRVKVTFSDLNGTVRPGMLAQISFNAPK